MLLTSLMKAGVVRPGRLLSFSVRAIGTWQVLLVTYLAIVATAADAGDDIATTLDFRGIRQTARPML